MNKEKEVEQKFGSSMEEDTTPLSGHRSSNQPDNPYLRMKPTYNDALLSKVTDDSNCMGLNTFQFIHF